MILFLKKFLVENHVALILFAVGKVNGGVSEVTAASSHMMMC